MLGTKCSVELLFSAFTHVQDGVISFTVIASELMCWNLPAKWPTWTWRWCKSIRPCKQLQNKFKFLDLVASGSGIFGDDWVRSWIDALKNIGVDPFSNEPGKTLMPAPAEDGTNSSTGLGER